VEVRRTKYEHLRGVLLMKEKKQDKKVENIPYTTRQRIASQKAMKEQEQSYEAKLKKRLADGE